jgi:hypothetical protein
MKTLGISTFLLTLSFLIASTGFAQPNGDVFRRGFLNSDSILGSGIIANDNGTLAIDSDSLVGMLGSITIHGGPNEDSKLFGPNGIIVPEPSGSSLKHYFKKDDKRYYIDNVPPTQKGKEIDHTHVWLLGDK